LRVEKWNFQVASGGGNAEGAAQHGQPLSAHGGRPGDRRRFQIPDLPQTYREFLVGPTAEVRDRQLGKVGAKPSSTLLMPTSTGASRLPMAPARGTASSGNLKKTYSEEERHMPKSVGSRMKERHHFVELRLNLQRGSINHDKMSVLRAVLMRGVCSKTSATGRIAARSVMTRKTASGRVEVGFVERAGETFLRIVCLDRTDLLSAVIAAMNTRLVD